jgi:hypothetical protein
MWEKGLFSLARFRWSLEHAESAERAFLFDSLIPLKSGTGFPNQANHQP